uniref:Uncharacterized protein n=1 Tax=Spironucleus salmonicida TaxID=348837 RepID=V6M0Y0_9EUKA|eukprot:EST46809.1 Hypothetical protein SS50377_13173 [Spironucleus salmonicida]
MLKCQCEIWDGKFGGCREGRMWEVMECGNGVEMQVLVFQGWEMEMGRDSVVGGVIGGGERLRQFQSLGWNFMGEREGIEQGKFVMNNKEVGVNFGLTFIGSEYLVMCKDNINVLKSNNRNL